MHNKRLLNVKFVVYDNMMVGYNYPGATHVVFRNEIHHTHIQKVFGKHLT